MSDELYSLSSLSPVQYPFLVEARGQRTLLLYSSTINIKVKDNYQQIPGKGTRWRGRVPHSPTLLLVSILPPLTSSVLASAEAPGKEMCRAQLLLVANGRGYQRPHKWHSLTTIIKLNIHTWDQRTGQTVSWFTIHNPTSQQDLFFCLF